jgi:glycosyltransferase involved in cell wall biosynthesis
VLELRISVVISSYQRPRSLYQLLEALAAQTLDPDEFEVIVVDNGSGPETEQIIADAQSRLDLTLRAIRHQVTLGPAGGRNSGWRLAESPLVAFTDDDCRPAADWLEQLLAAAAALGEDRPPTVIQGATFPEPDQLERMRHTLFTRIVSVQMADGRFETCNILYPWALLEELGGFDESFLPRGIGARPVGEDTDLGWRALAVGARSAFAPQAIVYHEVSDLGVVGKLKHQTRWAGAVHIFKVHPEAREILFRRYFWNVWHYMGWRALLSFAGPVWLRRMLIGRYLLAMSRRARETGAGPWAVPFLITQDATEAVVLLIASIRERTPLL